MATYRRRFKTDTQWLRVALAAAGLGVTLVIASRTAWKSDVPLYIGIALMVVGAYIALAVLALPLPLPQLLAERRMRAFRQQAGTFIVEGHELSTHEVANDLELAELRAAYLDWRGRVQTWLSDNVGPADAAAFEHAVGNAAAIPGSYDPEHNDLRLRLTWQLDVLHALRSRAA